jgi:hypothetical protein
MRLRRSRAPALLLLLPALRVLAASTANVATDQTLARAAAPAYAEVSGAPNPTLAPTSGSKATKDAPYDGVDGMPHEGPYVNDPLKADATQAKKAPAIVEELGPKKTIVGPAKGVKEDAVLDGDKSVMQDPDRKSATGTKGTEGGVSAKDKERLAHEDKTGEKLEKVPESPKEAPPLPHGEQKQIHGDVLDAASSTRGPGAVGLEVSRQLASISRSNNSTETHWPARDSARHSAPQARLAVWQGPLGHDPEDDSSCLESTWGRRRRDTALPLLRARLHHDHLFRDWRQDVPRCRTNGNATPASARLLRRFFRAHSDDGPFRCTRSRCPLAVE